MSFKHSSKYTDIFLFDFIHWRGYYRLHSVKGTFENASGSGISGYQAVGVLPEIGMILK